MENKDQQILKTALSGDINAFQILFGEFQNQLKSYLFRLTANRNDAEDLTHDTFIKAYDKLSTFKGESSLKTWCSKLQQTFLTTICNAKNVGLPMLANKLKK